MNLETPWASWIFWPTTQKQKWWIPDGYCAKIFKLLKNCKSKILLLFESGADGAFYSLLWISYLGGCTFLLLLWSCRALWWRLRCSPGWDRSSIHLGEKTQPWDADQRRKVEAAAVLTSSSLTRLLYFLKNRLVCYVFQVWNKPLRESVNSWGSNFGLEPLLINGLLLMICIIGRDYYVPSHGRWYKTHV